MRSSAPRSTCSATEASTESDENGPKRSCAINGGFYRKSPEHGAQYPTVVIAVDDIADSIQKVAAAGGTVIGQPMPIPGVGTYAAFTDTEGNRIAMLQPLPRTGAPPASR